MEKNLASGSVTTLFSGLMKKISLFIQLAVLTAAMPAFGWVGGPFDNGDYGILMERGGFYQATFTYKNGSGYAIWTPDNLQGAVNTGTVVDNAGYGSLFTPSTSGNGSHNGNRSVFYYKGITYFGSAMGEITLDERKIQGFCNATSEFGVAVTTAQTNTGLFAQSSATAASSTTVVASGRSYIINLNWRGNVTDTSPQMTFEGEGEMAIIAPNGREALATLAYEGYSGLIQAIITSVGRSGAQVDFDPAIYGEAQEAIEDALIGTTGSAAGTVSNSTTLDNVTVTNGVVTTNTSNTLTNTTTTSGAPSSGGLLPFLEGTGPQNNYDEAIKEKVKVSGIRRFF